MSTHRVKTVPNRPAASGDEARNDSGRYVDASLLASVEAFLGRMREVRSGAQLCSADELFRVGQFLYHEAALLDARRYEQWFELLAPDFVYWIPSTYGAASLHTTVSVNFEDRRRILDRIAFTSSGIQIAQTPPSRTLRSIGNIQAWRGTGESIDVTAGIVIHSYRRGTNAVFMGRLHVLLQPAGESFQIRMRVIELLDCDEPQGNNSFIL